MKAQAKYYAVLKLLLGSFNQQKKKSCQFAYTGVMTGILSLGIPDLCPEHGLKRLLMQLHAHP